MAHPLSSVAAAAAAARSSSVHYATVEKELVPPRDLDEVTNEIMATQDLYNNVQKTYG